MLFNSIAQQTLPPSLVELVIIDELAHHRMQVLFAYFVSRSPPSLPPFHTRAQPPNITPLSKTKRF